MGDRLMLFSERAILIPYKIVKREYVAWSQE